MNIRHNFERFYIDTSIKKLFTVGILDIIYYIFLYWVRSK